MKTTGTPAVEWPPGGASSTTSTASPRRAPTDFGALLDKHQARTAVAEGPKKKEATKPEQHKLEREAPVAPQHAEPKAPEAKPEATAPATEQQQPQPQGEQGDQPTVETPVVAVDPLVELTQPVLAEPQPQQPTAPVAEQPAVEVPAQQQPVAAGEAPAAVQASVTAPAAPAQAPVEPAALAVEQQQPQQPQAQQPAAPVAAEQAQAEAPVADDAPQAPVVRVDKPAQPQAQPQAQQAQQQNGQQPQQQGADQRAADQPRAQVQPQAEAAARPEPKAAPAPAPAPAAPQAPVTAPVAASGPQTAAPAATTHARSVPLSRAAEAVENVIRLGSARGVTHARMSLRPADLGGVEIRLQQTHHGLVASVVADGAEAAQALQQAGHDLRRQLEAQGIELQRLDISYSGDQRSGARSAQAETAGERRSPGGSNDSHATDGGDLTPTDEATAIATLELPDGVLVDVLA